MICLVANSRDLVKKLTKYDKIDKDGWVIYDPDDEIKPHETNPYYNPHWMFNTEEDQYSAEREEIHQFDRSFK